MGAALALAVRGEAAIEARLGALIGAHADLSELTGAFGLYLESATIERFDNETAPDGSKWTPSARAKEEGGKTLTDTSQLRSSITHNADGDSVEVGTNKIYAGVHQYGATIRAKNAPYLAFRLPGDLGFRKVAQVTIPARRFLGISAEDETELFALADDFERDVAGGAA